MLPGAADGGEGAVGERDPDRSAIGGGATDRSRRGRLGCGSWVCRRATARRAVRPVPCQTREAEGRGDDGAPA